MKPELDHATQEIIDLFMKLAEIPRKSGHERAVSDYLLKWATAHGFKAIQDQINNVIIEKPADSGCETKPLTILQGHMDMVCVADEGYDYDPLTDSIQVVNNNNETLTAFHTSLGADDGIGVAIAQYILTSATGCGPLRVIFTVNEEELMLGAKELDFSHLNAACLINLDSENDSILTNSSAGGMSVIMENTPDVLPPLLDKPICLSISGLTGGHSGVEINAGRLNAIRAISYTLLALEQANIHYELSSISGGTADNAIPSSCNAEILIHSTDFALFDATFTQVKQLLHNTYCHIEKNMNFTYCDSTMPKEVLSDFDRSSVVTCTTQVINGVNTMSPFIYGLVQSSSNLGIIKIDTAGIFISVYWRSSDELFIEQMNAQNTALSQMCGLSLTLKSRAPGWPINPDSILVPLVKRIYKEQTGNDLAVEAIHAGLECSWFYQKNPDLDLISVGPNLHAVHSPGETLEIASISKTLNLVLETLQRLS
ncbi:MAG: beta-Ala-His dipeptidase [Lachnospiraceae bacterium]